MIKKLYFLIPGSAFTPSMFSDVIKELPPLINESDLHLSQLTLHLLTSVSRVSKSSMSMVHDGILTQLFSLIRSPLLQGTQPPPLTFFPVHLDIRMNVPVLSCLQGRLSAL